MGGKEGDLHGGVQLVEETNLLLPSGSHFHPYQREVATQIVHLWQLLDPSLSQE
jgi:hypothetical protein